MLTTRKFAGVADIHFMNLHLLWRLEALPLSRWSLTANTTDTAWAQAASIRTMKVCTMSVGLAGSILGQGLVKCRRWSRDTWNVGERTRSRSRSRTWERSGCLGGGWTNGDGCCWSEIIVYAVHNVISYWFIIDTENITGWVWIGEPTNTQWINATSGHTKFIFSFTIGIGDTCNGSWLGLKCRRFRSWADVGAGRSECSWLNSGPKSWCSGRRSKRLRMDRYYTNRTYSVIIAGYHIVNVVVVVLLARSLQDKAKWVTDL